MADAIILMGPIRLLCLLFVVLLVVTTTFSVALTLLLLPFKIIFWTLSAIFTLLKSIIGWVVLLLVGGGCCWQSTFF